MFARGQKAGVQKVYPKILSMDLNTGVIQAMIEMSKSSGNRKQLEGMKELIHYLCDQPEEYPLNILGVMACAQVKAKKVDDTNFSDEAQRVAALAKVKEFISV